VRELNEERCLRSLGLQARGLGLESPKLLASDFDSSIRSGIALAYSMEAFAMNWLGVSPSFRAALQMICIPRRDNQTRTVVIEEFPPRRRLPLEVAAWVSTLPAAMAIFPSTGIGGLKEQNMTRNF